MSNEFHWQPWPKWVFLLLSPLTAVLPHALSCIGSNNYMSTGSIEVTELHPRSNHSFLLVFQYPVLSVS